MTGRSNGGNSLGKDFLLMKIIIFFRLFTANNVFVLIILVSIGDYLQASNQIDALK